MARDDDSFEREGISEAPEGATGFSLSAYAENEDVVTQFVETPRPPASWIVQLTPLDRRVMSTEQLLAELERGRFVHADTLVWRKGMNEWRCVANVDFAHPAPSRARPPTSLRPQLLGLHWPSRLRQRRIAIELGARALCALGHELVRCGCPRRQSSGIASADRG
ncbi:MAG TPA: DUF4339 domain-containing protein [Polyangiaceae bacterium]|nr:DUF4339 domain-containing protein [Polyangiaceae bacterium]